MYMRKKFIPHAQIASKKVILDIRYMSRKRSIDLTCTKEEFYL